MSFSSEIESSATEMELLDSSSSLSPMSGSCTESNPLVDTEDETGTLSSCSVDLSSTEFELLDSDLELLGSSDHDENSFGDGAATDEPSLDPRPNPRGRVWGKTLPGSVLSAGMLP